MTPEERATLDVMQTLDDAAVPWMLTGSLAANLYMIPRSTQDADFVIQADAPSWRRVVARLPPSVTLDPQMRFETITATTRYDLAVNGTKFRIELFNLSDDSRIEELLTEGHGSIVLSLASKQRERLIDDVI